MKLPEDEHVPVHAYMMAVAIKMVSATQFGAYFRDDETIKNFHQLYERVRLIYSLSQFCAPVKDYFTKT